MRDVMPPQAVFLRVGESLAGRSPGFPNAHTFVRWREEAEVRARKARGDAEPTLEEIYVQLAFLANKFVRRREVESWRQVELECEEASLRPVPGAKEKLAAAAASGGRVRYLSDTYFPPEFLRQQLEKHGLWVDGAALFVSCHERCNKETGGLFRTVLEREGADPGDLTHCGNDPAGDDASPRRLGCRVVPETGANATRYEKILAADWEYTEGATGVLAAAARSARLECAGIDPAVARVAAGVVGPLLACYLSWMFQRARADGVRTLYFVARDGQLMYEAARILGQSMAPDIELRYLYGSRQAWYVAALTTLDDASLEWILAADDPTTLRTILERVNVEPRQVAEVLQRYGYAEADWDRPVMTGDLAKLRDVLRDPAASETILAAARQARELTIQYFQQEGLTSGVRTGLVDVGWTGRTHDCACDLVVQAGGVAPVGYFMGLKKGRGLEGNYVHEGYLFDQYRGLGYLELTYCPIALETFFTADHGSVRGYVTTAGRIGPQLTTEVNTSAMGWGYSNVKAVVLVYMTHLSSSSGVVAQPGINLRAVCAQLLNAFWLTPVADEARAWGAFPFETDQTCAHSLPLATGFTAADVLRVGLTGRYKSHAASWLEASLALTRPSLRFLLLFVWSARRISLDLTRLVRGRLSAGEFARRNRRLVRGFVQSRRRLWHPATIEAAV